MDVVEAAKKMSWGMVKSFPDLDRVELEQEAYTLLLEHAGMDDASRYVSSNWRLYDYALRSVNSLRNSSDHIKWLAVDRRDRLELITALADAEVQLTSDGKFVVEGILSGKLIVPRDNYIRATLSMRLVKDNLIKFGWQAYRALQAVNEVKEWWRSYGIA